VFLSRLSKYWFVALLGAIAVASVSQTLADPPSPLAPTEDSIGRD